jgi:hypothetical protein
MKKILVVQYSQTGQLASVVSSFCRPLQDSNAVEVTIESLQPVKPYPFPWTFFDFLDQFPESVYLDPPELQPLTIAAEQEFDLIIIAYTVWFLSPAPSVTTFVTSEQGKRLLHNKPVITLIACRDMWVMAQETMKDLLATAGARLLDNVVLTDQGSTMASLVTTPHWLLTGRKEAFWGFPPAGIAEDEIQRACRFGLALEQALAKDEEKDSAALLSGLGAVKVDVSLVKSEKIGQRSFRVWGRLLRNVGPQGAARRKPVLLLYVIFLLLMIVTVVPINLLLKRVLMAVSREKQIEMKKYYEQPSGSGEERIEQFRC